MYRRYSVNIVRVTRYETEYQVVFSGMEKKKKKIIIRVRSVLTAQPRGSCVRVKHEKNKNKNKKLGTTTLRQNIHNPIFTSVPR